MKIGETWTAEVATGNDPEVALAAAVREFAGKPIVVSMEVAHDDECPCLGNEAPMHSCTCEIISLKATRVR